MRKYTRQASAARGFSLVELMIALLIGLMISIGVVQIFSGTRNTYQLDESLARAQENGRFALEFLTQDIRHAGYAGCKRDTTVAIFNNLAYTTNAGLFLTGIAGAEFVGTAVNDPYTLAAAPTNTTTGWAPALTAITGIPATALAVPATGALPGSDVLALQRMVPNAWALAPPYVTADNVFIDPAFVPKVKDRDVLLVADCKSAVAFMVTAISPAGVIDHTVSPTTNRCLRWTGGLDIPNSPTANCAAAFDYDVVPSTTAIGKLETIVFFVANDAANANRPTLFRRVIAADGTIIDNAALVEGVENFQVLYGVDNGVPADGTPDQYVPASGVANFAQVVSVHIGLLVYGVNASGAANDMEFDTDTHVVAGTTLTPPANDRRKRRAFNTTIQLRNRSF